MHSAQNNSVQPKRRPLIAGNWKMYKTVAEAVAFINHVKSKLNGLDDRDVLICPPCTALAPVADLLRGSRIALGAQNVYPEPKGAFTGEISPEMLADVGCAYVIIGHSERRQYFSETDAFVNKKIKAGLLHNLIPIVCIGETLKEREENRTYEILKTQLTLGLAGIKTTGDNIVVAYEPVWAIGTGKTATTQQAQEAHAFIRDQLAAVLNRGVAGKIRILYGGSIKPENIDGLMTQPDVDGGLVGGASLDAESFIRIVKFQR